MCTHTCVLSLAHFVSLQSKKNLDIIKAWKLTCDVCHSEYIELYDKLDISYHLESESFYPDRMNEVKKFEDEGVMVGDDE